MPRYIDRRQVEMLFWRFSIRHPQCPLKATTRGVLNALSLWGDKDGGGMYPSMELISVASGNHRETVRRELRIADDLGFLIREEQEAGLKRWYRYFAAVPNGWQFDSLKTLRAWEKDPIYASERLKTGKKCPSDTPGHADDDVPADDRDMSPPAAVAVPANGCECPSPAPALSQRIAVDVPATDSPTSYRDPEEEPSSVTNPMTEPKIRDALSEVKDIPRKSPYAESRKSKNAHSFEQINNRIEMIFAEHSLKAIPLEITEIGYLAQVTGYTSNQVSKAISQLLDRKRLPIPPRGQLTQEAQQ